MALRFPGVLRDLDSALAESSRLNKWTEAMLVARPSGRVLVLASGAELRPPMRRTFPAHDELRKHVRRSGNSQRAPWALKEGELRFISTRAHGATDYLMGVLLIVLPYILGFADGTSAQWIPQIIGAAVIAASLLTDYEFGAVRMIPMPVHLFLDVAAGLLLAISPWLFGFADRVFWPHLILGILEIGAGLTTRTTPETSAGTSADRSATANRRSY